MEKSPKSPRVACMRETEKHFFFAIKKPLDDVTDTVFQNLAEQSDFVRQLKEGSQVFVFPRTRFGSPVVDREEAFVRYIETTTEIIGQVALDPFMANVYDKIDPHPMPKRRGTNSPANLNTASDRGALERLKETTNELLGDIISEGPDPSPA